MELLALILVTAGVLGFSAWREYLMVDERKAMENERKEMLDRLMSRDLVEFKESNEPPAPPLKDESKNGEKKEDYIPLTTRPLTEDEVLEVYGGEEN